MMTELTLRLDDEPVGATRVLHIAQATVRALRKVESNMTGERAAIEWRVDIMTGPRIALIRLSDVTGTVSSMHQSFKVAQEVVRGLTRMAGRVEDG